MKFGGLKRLAFMALASILISMHLVAPVAAIVGGSSNNSVRYGTNFTAGSLSFSSIQFWDYSSGIRAFGLSGRVYNTANHEVAFTSIATYYTRSGVVVAESTNNQVAPGRMAIAFTQMSNWDIIESGYTPADIDHYDVTVKINYEEGEEGKEEDDSRDIATTPSLNPSHDHYDYVIDAYDINIKVNENNTYDITENITAYFNTERHGIFRTLPLRSTIERLDGTSNTIRTPISNIEVSGDSYTVSNESGNTKIKIGNADRYIVGKKDYEIKYTYNFGEDTLKDADEFYFNLIGNEWDTVIGNITFTIEMPKEFDASKLGFSTGKYGSTSNNGIMFTVAGKTITGKFNGILGTRSALTVRTELEEGYWQNTETTVEWWEYLMIIIPACGLVVSFLLWLLFGNDENVVETVEFYPPEGMNSLDIALIAKGRVDSGDVVSLLFYLASKGYIRIEEKPYATAHSSDKYRIIKVKEYDGNNEFEEMFMSGLFKKARVYSSHELAEIIKKIEDGEALTNKQLHAAKRVDGVEEVSISRLRDSFYKTIDKIKDKVNDKKVRSVYYFNTSLPTVLTVIAIIISVIFLVLIPSIAMNSVETALMIIGLCVFYSPFFIAGFATKGITRFFVLGFTIFHSSMFLFAIAGEMDMLSDPLYVKLLAGGIACIVGMIFFCKYMPKRKPEANELYGKIKGLKTFMKNAEKDRLEFMLASDPNYAYALLPYAYVLGVSTKWMKQFEQLSHPIESPSWYVGKSDFDYRTFHSSMGSMMSSMNSAMTSSPSSSGGGGGSSGGGSSGGGSSGGGGGGGGGGSW